MDINIGDIVITTFGRHGSVRNICNCDYCKERGYCEPLIVFEDGGYDGISVYQAMDGFKDWYQIGDTVFKEHVQTNAIENRITTLNEEISKLQTELKDCQWMLEKSAINIDEDDD